MIRFIGVLLGVLFATLPLSALPPRFYNQEIENVTLRVLRPAEVKLAAERSTSLLVMNNAPIQEKGVGHRYDDGDVRGTINFEVDTLTTEFTAALAHILESEEYFGRVEVMPQTVQSPLAPLRAARLNPSEVKMYAAQFEVDNLLVVEFVKIESSLVVGSPNVSSIGRVEYAAAYDLKFTLQASLYTNQGTQLKHTYKLVDSSFIEGVGSTVDEAISRLPQPIDVFGESTVRAAVQFAGKIVPAPDEVERTYFVTLRSKPAEEAAKQVKAGDWEAAKQIWEETIAEDKSSKEVVYAYANLALYHEVNDQLDEAIAMLKRGMEFYSSREKAKANKLPLSFMTSYTSVLEQRKKDIVEIENQLGR